MTNGNGELPTGWRWTRLADVLEVAQPGFASGARDPKGVIQLRMNNVDTRGNLVWTDVLRVPRTATTIEKYQLREGDVAFNNTNSSELVGKSAYFLGLSEPVVFSNHFTRLRVKPEVLDSRFLAVWLRFQWQSRVFESLCNRWIGQSAVKNEKLLGLDIPLPSLSEQKRIAALLFEHMRAMERARVANQEQLEAARALPRAYLREVFESNDTKEWPKQPLGQVCEISAGQVDPTLPEYSDLPHVNGANIESGTGRLIQVRTAAEDRMTSGKYLFESGNVLYSKLRPYLRKVALVDFRGVCSADMYPIRVDASVLTPEYLMWLLLSDSFTQYADEQSRRARMPKLNREQLFAWQAPLPPIDMQVRIAQRLAERLVHASAAVCEIESQLAAIEQLPNALLRQAFGGEL